VFLAQRVSELEGSEKDFKKQIAEKDATIATKDQVIVAKDLEIEQLKKEKALQAKRIADLEAQLTLPRTPPPTAKPTTPVALASPPAARRTPGIDLPLSFLLFLLSGSHLPYSLPTHCPGGVPGRRNEDHTNH
jgi:hypothetical protein